MLILNGYFSHSISGNKTYTNSFGNTVLDYAIVNEFFFK